MTSYNINDVRHRYCGNCHVFLGEEERMIDKHAAGLYRKFEVRRTDGSDAPGGKHEHCEYFVLDATHDPCAIPALRAYANACRAEYPRLAEDLDALAERHGRKETRHE